MALPPLELFSLKGKAALLPGGFSVYLRNFGGPAEGGSGLGGGCGRRSNSSTPLRAGLLYEPSRQRYNQQASHPSATPRQADVAQLVEQPIRNRQVSGSSPLVGSRSFEIPFLPVANSPKNVVDEPHCVRVIHCFLYPGP